MSTPSIRTILCTVDLSPASRPVLAWAGRFADAFGAKVTVLHVESFEPPRYFSRSQIEALAAQSEANREILTEEIRRLAGETLPPGALLDVVVQAGHPIPEILQRIASDSPDLVVLGSHGRSGVSRLLLGSVAENVMREATGLTLVVKETEGAAADPLRILCPVNFTDLGARCLEVSSAVAVAFKARLDVVHASETGGGKPAVDLQRFCRRVSDESRQRCNLSETVRDGGAAEQIILLAKERAVDLIILGARHNRFLEVTTLGTTTERVMRHGPCSVLMVPQPADSGRN